MASVTMNVTNPNIATMFPGVACWHVRMPVLVAGGSVTFTRNSEQDLTVYFSGTITNSLYNGSYGFSVGWYLSGPSGIIASGNVTNKSASGSAILDGSFQAESIGSVTLHYTCSQTGGCQQGTPDVIVGSFDLSSLPYNPDVPPTNVSSGSVYNQNGVKNGDSKPDWNFYVDWTGDSAGTHTITRHNLNIYLSTNLTATAATIVGVTKYTRYNFETYLPKCKPGETYNFYISMLIDNSYYMSNVYIGQIKLYKDGIVYVKNYSTGVQTEATKGYVKYYQDGTQKKVRYIYVKDYNTRSSENNRYVYYSL